jgi:hypothetical protein
LENISARHLTKHNIEKGIHVTGIYHLNGYISGEDEFHRPVLLTELSQVAAPASAQ